MEYKLVDISNDERFSWNSDQSFYLDSTIYAKGEEVYNKDKENRIILRPEDSNKDIENDIKNTEIIVQVAISDLMNYMKEKNGFDRNYDFWYLFLGRWFQAFIFVCLRRERDLLAAKERIGNFKIKSGIRSEEAYFPFNASKSWYNTYIYSELAKYIDGIELQESLIHYEPNKENGSTNNKNIYSLISTRLPQTIPFFLQGLLPNILKRIGFTPKILFIGECYINTCSLIKICINTNIKPLFFRGVKYNKISPADHKLRSKLFKSNLLDKPWINELLRKELPTIYLEGFLDLYAYTIKNSPNFPKVIITALSMHYPNTSLLYMAEAKNQKNTKLLYSQHGGGYFLEKHSLPDIFSLKVFDKVYTWSRIDQNKYNANCKQMPSHRLNQFNFRKSTNKNLSNKRKASILIVASSNSLYKNSPMCGYEGHSFILHLRQVIDLANNLDSEIFNIRIRTFVPLWDDVNKYLVNINNKCNIYCGRKNMMGVRGDFRSDLNNSDIVIHTTNQTTYLECLSQNIPSFILWDDSSSEFPNHLKKYLNKLKEQSIFFNCPINLANHLNKYGNRSLDLWHNENTKTAINDFIFNCCLRGKSKEYISSWSKEVNELMRSLK